MKVLAVELLKNFMKSYGKTDPVQWLWSQRTEPRLRIGVGAGGNFCASIRERALNFLAGDVV